MTGDRVTVFIEALLNGRDQYYIQARALLPRVRNAAQVWVTEAVLIKVGNALSAFNRIASRDSVYPAQVSGRN
jgi:hypothetical protein